MLPIWLVTGVATVGAGWYVSRLARGPDVIWDRKVSCLRQRCVTVIERKRKRDFRMSDELASGRWRSGAKGAVRYAEERCRDVHWQRTNQQ